MRLKDANQATTWELLTCCLQSCTNRSGMVGIIVHDGDATPLAEDLESPSNSAKGLGSTSDLIGTQPSGMSQGRRGKRIQDMVLSWNIEFYLNKGSSMMQDLKAMSQLSP